MEVTCMTSESEEQMVFKGGIGSPCTEEASSGGSVGLSGVPVKKGPWTSTEDAILMDYVKKHGEGNWNAVQKHSGLARCGKSCRLRWTNHLRPDLKKGSFTPEEERRIVELHAKMGNKWAKMALELPGRTDNEIKNYWNTRIKRRQRAGLPIYPADICLQALTESQSENMYALSSGNNSHTPDLLPFNGLEIPAVEFKSLDLNHRYYSPPTLNIPPSNLHGNPFLAEDVDSSYSSKYLLSAVQPTKRFRRSESLLPGLNPGFSSGFPGCTKIHKDASVPNLQSFWFNSEYYQNPALDYASSSSCVPSASQNFNGVSVLPSSEPTWAMKELPSLQTQTGSWAPPPSSPLPSLESVDALFQSPPTEHTESGSLSPRNSGLLDAVLYESRSLKTPKNDPCQQKPEIPTVPGEVIGNGNCNASCDHDDDVAEWDSYLDPNSPLGHSAASVFSNYTTPVSGSSLDDPQSFETFPGSKLNTEGEVIIPTEFSDENNKKSNSNDLLYTRPDFLLGSNYFRPQTEHGQHIYVERCGWSPTW